MKKIFALSLAGLTVASMGAVAAMPMIFRDNEELNNAISSNNYEEFLLELEQTNPEMAEQMSEFRFEKLTQQNNRMIAIENEDYQAWKDTFPENSRIDHSEEMFNEMVLRFKNHEVIEKALEEGNYASWKLAVEQYGYGKGISNVVSEEDFNKLREIHQLREENVYEGTRGFGMNKGSEMMQKNSMNKELGDCSGNQDGMRARGQRIHYKG